MLAKADRLTPRERFMLPALAAGVVMLLLVSLATAVTASAVSLKGLPPRAYVVGTYDGSTLRLYINGKELASAPASGVPDKVKTPLELGSYAGQAVWNGKIDEVAVYDRALSPATIARRYDVGLGKVKSDYSRLVSSTGGLVAYYRLDETSGRKVTGQRGPAGTYEPGVQLHAGGLISGDSDSAIQLNGKAGSVTIPATASLQLGRRFTLEAWVTLIGAGNRHIVSRVNSYFLKTDLLGKWATGFYSRGKIFSVTSPKAAVSLKSSAPASGKSQPVVAKAKKKKKKKGGGGGAAVPVVLVLAGIAAGWVAVNRGRRRTDSAPE